MIEHVFAEFGNFFSQAWWQTHWLPILSVISIDLVLAGDNAIVVGVAASQVSREIRAKVIFWGIAAAVILRIGFAAVAQELLGILGLTLAGGILLLWVCWKLYRQITSGNGHQPDVAGGMNPTESRQNRVGFWTAVLQITIADISMSLDNVLAVAGAAGESKLVLVIGLAVAIILMAVASNFIATLLVKYPWITWVGLLIILYVAVNMVFCGYNEVTCKTNNTGCEFAREGSWLLKCHRPPEFFSAP